MLWIATEANIFKIMGEQKVRSVTIDFVPSRAALLIPRLNGDDPVTSCAPHVEEVTFHLEDAMFGGEVFTAITCRGNVVVLPFPWTSWDGLAKSRITPVG